MPAMVVEIALTVRQTDQNHLTLDHLTLDRQTDCRMTWEIFALLPISFEVSRGKSGKVALLVDLYYFLRGAFPRDYKQHVRVRKSQE